MSKLTTICEMKLEKLFKILYKLPKSGIYSLIDEGNKVIYITYSRNILQSLGRNISQIQDKTHNYKHLIKYSKKLQFKFLEVINFEDSQSDIWVKLLAQIEVYKQLDYRVINKHNIPKYHIKFDVDEDIRFVFVKLVTANYKHEIVVGKFDTMNEAKEFSQIFHSMKAITPVYAVNKLSREYFSK